VFIKRLESWPDPVNGRGVFDISKVVRDYITLNFSPDASNIRVQEMGSGEFFIDVVCKFGENDNGTVTTDIVTDSSRRYYNHYNSRLVGSDTILSDFLDKPLTNRPLTGNTVELDDDFLFIPYFPTDGDDVTIELKSYDSSGLQDSKTVVRTPTAANILQLYNASPTGVNIGTPIVVSDTLYYTVQFLNPNISDEPLYRFDITCEPKYETHKLHFLNKFGGFETFPFRKVSRRRVEMEKKDFRQRGYSMDASGVISRYNSNNVYREERSTYSSTFDEKLKLSSDFLSDGEYTWLSELVLSPLVYIEESGYFLPITIRQNDYEFKKRVNDKLTTLSLEIEYGGKYNAQFR
jgi:hypothetical protein